MVEGLCCWIELLIMNCPTCEIPLEELSIYDDWEGKLTCPECGQRYSIKEPVVEEENYQI